MKISEINIRDPFVLTYDNKYYLYGTRAQWTWKAPKTLSQLGFDVYISDNLEDWEKIESIFNWFPGFWSNEKFWAPEVHEYKGKFYMFATFGNSKKHKGTQILVADKPTGPFKIHSKYPITPSEWECLDGTLYVENEIPYMIFCHEWQQIGVGEICIVELSKDLSEAIGVPRTIIKANESEWAKKDEEAKFVTDGPFLVKEKARIYMIWSSFVSNKYVLAVSYTDEGIMGKWKTSENLLFDQDGGHGMIFNDFEGNSLLTLHTPNTHLEEKPIFVRIRIDDMGITKER